MRIIFLSLVGLLLLGGARRALAEPVHMVCKGEDYFETGPRQARTVAGASSARRFLRPLLSREDVSVNLARKTRGEIADSYLLFEN
jgi:hypothetical protein